MKKTLDYFDLIDNSLLYLDRLIIKYKYLNCTQDLVNVTKAKINVYGVSSLHNGLIPLYTDHPLPIPVDVANGQVGLTCQTVEIIKLPSNNNIYSILIEIDDFDKIRLHSIDGIVQERSYEMGHKVVYTSMYDYECKVI